MTRKSPADRRKVKPVLRYYCPECRWFWPTESDNGWCMGLDHETPTGMRKGRKRLVWICPDCGEEEDHYLSREDFLEHTHE